MSTNEALPGVQRPMRAVLRWGTLAAVGALVLAGVVGYLVDGSSGLWGGVLGIAVPVAFFTVTVIVAIVTVRLRPEILGAAILGSWILKLIILIAVLAALSNADFYNRTVFFIAFTLGTVGYLILEAVIVVRTRVPYTEPIS